MASFTNDRITGKRFKRTGSNYPIGSRARALREYKDSKLRLLRALDEERIGCDLLRFACSAAMRAHRNVL